MRPPLVPAMFTSEPDPERVASLAALLHDQRIGCRMEPEDRFDVGMPWRHTGDHDAVALAILSGYGVVRQIEYP